MTLLFLKLFLLNRRRTINLSFSDVQGCQKPKTLMSELSWCRYFPIQITNIRKPGHASKPLDLALYVYMNIACINMHTFNMQVKVCLDVHPCRYDAHSSRPRVSSMP